MNKITLETRYSKVTVEVEEDDDLTMEGTINLLVVPVLKGAGFLDETIEKYIAIS